MQRLFSTFASGWPGIGLLLLRLLTGIALVHSGIDATLAAPPLVTLVLEITGMAAGVLLLVGLATPVSGTLAAMVKVWIAILSYTLHSGNSWTALAQAALGVVLAMVGPGAWSFDAHLFGRKRILFPKC